MFMYRRKREGQQEKIATAFLWLMALMCALYISWKINPYPLQQGIGWVGNQTEHFFDRCVEQALSQTLPTLSCFFLQDSVAQAADGEKDLLTGQVTDDPFYTKYLSFSQPGDG